MTRDGNTGELSYDHDAFIEYYRTAYYSKVSVCFILAGYLLGIFGSIGDSNRICIAFFVLILTVGMIMITKYCIDRIVKKDNAVQRKITDEELKNVDTEVDIEIVSNKVIDEELFMGETKPMHYTEKD